MVVDAPSVVIDHSKKSLASQWHTTQLQTYESWAFQVGSSLLQWKRGQHDERIQPISHPASTTPRFPRPLVGLSLAVRAEVRS